MEQTTVTDITFLKHFTSGDKQMITHLISVFFTTAKDKIEGMEKGISAGDWKEIGSIAHSFKPQLSYMGIKSAEELIKLIEESADSPAAAENIPSLFTSLRSVVDEAMEELKKVTERLS